MSFDTLNEILRRGPRISVANVELDQAEVARFHAAVKEIPEVSGTVMMADNRNSFEETVNRNIQIGNTVYAILGIMITIGMAYNSARIQLSERARELASLRILGFSRGEVSYVLMGETLVLALAAQPLGWLFGRWIAMAMIEGFSSDLYSIPLVLAPRTYAYASLVVLSAAIIATLVVRRRIDRMNLVAVMKTRE